MARKKRDAAAEYKPPPRLMTVVADDTLRSQLADLQRVRQQQLQSSRPVNQSDALRLAVELAWRQLCSPKGGQ